MLLKNLSAPLKTLDGKVIMQSSNEKPTPATLKNCYIEMIMAMRGVSGVESLKAYRFGGALLDAEEEFVLTDEQLKMLQEAVAGNPCVYTNQTLALCQMALEPEEAAVPPCTCE